MVFTEKIQPSCLPNKTHKDYLNTYNDDVWTVGWGINDENKMSDKLMNVQLRLFEFEECKLFKKNKSSSLQICAGKFYIKR